MFQQHVSSSSYAGAAAVCSFRSFHDPPSTTHTSNGSKCSRMDRHVLLPCNGHGPSHPTDGAQHGIHHSLYKNPQHQEIGETSIWQYTVGCFTLSGTFAARVPEVPRTSSTKSRPHRSSIDSTIPFDMLQLPNGERGSGLSAIDEGVNAGRASPSVNSTSGFAPPANLVHGSAY